MHLSYYRTRQVIIRFDNAYYSVGREFLHKEVLIRASVSTVKIYSEIKLSTFICSQRDPKSWSAMILNDEVSANAILKRATKHFTVLIRPKSATRRMGKRLPGVISRWPLRPPKGWPLGAQSGR